MTMKRTSLHQFIYNSNVNIIMSARKEINENIDVNEPEYNEKYTTKFNKDNNNFNKRTNKDYNDTLNQQQDAINKTR